MLACCFRSSNHISYEPCNSKSQIGYLLFDVKWLLHMTEVPQIIFPLIMSQISGAQGLAAASSACPWVALVSSLSTFPWDVNGQSWVDDSCKNINFLFHSAIPSDYLSFFSSK